MIEVSFTIQEWFIMPEEEQCRLCIALGNEYIRLEKPLHDKVWNDEREHINNAEIAYKILHDWRKAYSNLMYYAKSNEEITKHFPVNRDITYDRWERFWKVYNICGFLEYVNIQFLGVKNG